ncbi:hypothetical protein MTR_7g013500 [Medicago truncatula]|uniref:Uncharacterized protein n=1 Tax=Medicago truncatula TaxID=3880 RepID=G7L5B7_MEDTR|nr:hypothetical protein MTR_7g013500 [Medicago truncatula]
MSLLLFIYIGIPIFKGKPKFIHLKYILDKVKSKLAIWKGSLLTIMGRVLYAYSSSLASSAYFGIKPYYSSILNCSTWRIGDGKKYKGVFDLLKNEGQDRTTLVVQCLICKDKLEARDRTKTHIFVSHQITAQLFVLRTSCLEYQNILTVLQTKYTLNFWKLKWLDKPLMDMLCIPANILDHLDVKLTLYIGNA